MKFVTPEVYLIARPQINWVGAHDYLRSINAIGWLDRVEGTDAEKLIEFAGRACYRSWEPGLNANVTKVREDSGDYLSNIINVGHGSVLEHAQFSFMIKGLSRVATHELVRHRVGVAISQESLRYVRLTDLDVWLPEALKRDHTGHAPVMPGGGTAEEAIISMVEKLETLQGDLAKAFRLDDDGVPFEYKKAVTSAMRRIAPIGLATSMVWSANVRTLRHVLEMRTSRHAEEEIRLVFDQVGQIMQTEAPFLFADYKVEEVNGYNEWTTESGKV